MKLIRKDILPMWVSDIGFLAPREIIGSIEKRDEHGISGYIENMPESYCHAISHWLIKRHNWHVNKEWMICTPGVVPALCIALLAFTKPGDRIAVQSPVYSPFFNIIECNKRILVNNPLKLIDGHYEMDFIDLENKMRTGIKAFILCSPHNPVGRVWTLQELSRLGELCIKYKVLIFSDEIHSDIVFSGHRHIPLASVSESLAQSTVTYITPSKTFGIVGLSASITIIPDEELNKKYRKKLSGIGKATEDTIGITAAEEAYRYGDERIEYLIEYIQGNLQTVVDYFKKFIPGMKVIIPEGTYMVWLDCKGLGFQPDELQELMVRKAKIGLNNGSAFGYGGEGFLRMNIACPKATLLEGLSRIGNVVGEGSQLVNFSQGR